MIPENILTLSEEFTSSPRISSWNGGHSASTTIPGVKINAENKKRDSEMDRLIQMYDAYVNNKEIIELLQNSEHIESDFGSTSGEIFLNSLTEKINEYFIKAFSPIKEVKRILIIHSENLYEAFVYTSNQLYDDKLETRLVDKHYNLLKKFPKDNIEITFFAQWAGENDKRHPDGAKIIFGG